MQYLVCTSSIITLSHIRELLIHAPHPQLKPGGSSTWESDEERDRNWRVHLHNDAEKVQHHIFTGTADECQTFKRKYSGRLRSPKSPVVRCLDIIKSVAREHPESEHLHNYILQNEPEWLPTERESK